MAFKNLENIFQPLSLNAEVRKIFAALLCVSCLLVTIPSQADAREVSESEFTEIWKRKSCMPHLSEQEKAGLIGAWKGTGCKTRTSYYFKEFATQIIYKAEDSPTYFVAIPVERDLKKIAFASFEKLDSKMNAEGWIRFSNDLKQRVGKDMFVFPGKTNDTREHSFESGEWGIANVGPRSTGCLIPYKHEDTSPDFFLEHTVNYDDRQNLKVPRQAGVQLLCSNYVQITRCQDLPAAVSMDLCPKK